MVPGIKKPTSLVMKLSTDYHHHVDTMHPGHQTLVFPPPPENMMAPGPLPPLSSFVTRAPPHSPPPIPSESQRSPRLVFPNQVNENMPMNGPPGSMDIANQLKRKEMFSQRKQREFIPDNKKDESYWDRRRRNNEAAKRSREKRRFNDMILETRVVDLTRENTVLKAQLEAIEKKFGINGDMLINKDSILSQLPNNEQLLNMTKQRANLLAPTFLALNASPPLPSLMNPPPPQSEPGEPLSPMSNGGPPPPMGIPSHLDEFPADDAPPNRHQMSPEYYKTEMHPHVVYQTEAYHDQVSDEEALNLSREPSSRVNNHTLPHKLRHKYPNSEKENGVELLSPQKNERRTPDDTDDSNPSGSSDEQDSGLSVSSDRSVSTSPPAKRLRESYEQPQLRSELQRLASEVECLKSLLRRAPKSEVD